MLAYIPVEITGCRLRQAAGESCLANLPGSGNKNHLPRQVAPELSGQVTGGDVHTTSIPLFSTMVKITNGDLLLQEKTTAEVFTRSLSDRTC